MSMIFEIPIPTPQQALFIVSFSVGVLWGEAGSTFDWEVKYGKTKKWFNSLSLIQKTVVDFILNLTHHYQYGLVLVYLSQKYLSGDPLTFFMWAGWGLIISDWKDYQQILIRLGLEEKPPVETPAVEKIVVGEYTSTASADPLHPAG